MMQRKKQEFFVVIERDEDGYYIGEVPQLKGCYSQGETLDELMINIKEVVELCLEEKLDEWGKIWENFYDLVVSRSRRDETEVSWEELKAELELDKSVLNSVYNLLISMTQ
ncbi:MAG: type II toxin-antitoxin system HicB family antitoxin [Hydrococcus sp. RM1_1_31]|nr:type II toxin-antitoxin system HicB family antitoxin [Hydrococcus sp. RM1_1_31]